jgi:hypothetical protein
MRDKKKGRRRANQSVFDGERGRDFFHSGKISLFCSLFLMTAEFEIRVVGAVLAAATAKIVYSQYNATRRRAVLMARVLPASLVFDRALRDLNINDPSGIYKQTAHIQVKTSWISSNVRIATTMNDFTASHSSYLHHNIYLDAAATGVLERLANVADDYQSKRPGSSNYLPTSLHKYIETTFQRDVLDATGPEHVNTWTDKRNS